MRLTLGSLFDGSGGFPLAGLLEGIEPIWSSEVEPFPIRVTEKNLPFVKHYGDVSKLNGAELEPVDIITFGSPCQDISRAGKQKGVVDGQRSSLFFEAIRIIKEMREATNGEYPKYAVFENVEGARSSNKGEDLRIILEEFCKIKDPTVSIPKPDKWLGAAEIVAKDYSVAYRVLDAQYWGIPQRRKRIFLVADFGGQSAGQILFESESSYRDSVEEQAKEQTSSADTGNSIDIHGEQKFEGGGGITYPVENYPNDSRVKLCEDGICQTLSSWMGTGGNNVPLVLEQQNAPPIVLESNQNHATITNNGVCPTLTASMGAGGGYVPMIVQPKKNEAINEVES